MDRKTVKEIFKLTMEELFTKIVFPSFFPVIAVVGTKYANNNCHNKNMYIRTIKCFMRFKILILVSV